MACPDEVTLDLWLADALPSDEAATVAAHVSTCAPCLEARQAIEGWSTQLHAALALDPEELAQTEQDRLMVAAAMARLPPKQRLLLRLRYEQNLTLAEIARGPR